MNRTHWIVSVAVCVGLIFAASPIRAMDVEALFVGVVEDREQDSNLTYVFVVSLIGEDIAGGRVFRPGNPTPICQLDPDATFLGFDATCNILGTSVADFCGQFGFGDFIVEIDAAFGNDDTVTVNFDPGCADVFPGNVDITAPSTGGTVNPIPGPNSLCFDCTVADGCGERWQFEVSDDFGGIGTSQLVDTPPVPGCWDPGICLPPQSNYQWRASAIHIFEDNVPNATDLGDGFSQTAFYQNANLDYFNVVLPAPSTPSAVSAGAGGTIPLLVEKLSSDGFGLQLYWDEVACCGNTDSHLVYGTSADLPAAVGGTYALDGSECSIGVDGFYDWNSVPSPAAGDFLWWVLLNDDAAGTEGSWGLDSSGQERTGPGVGGTSAQCGITAKSLTNSCGQ